MRNGIGSLHAIEFGFVTGVEIMHANYQISKSLSFLALCIVDTESIAALSLVSFHLFVRMALSHLWDCVRT